MTAYRAALASLIAIPLIACAAAPGDGSDIGTTEDALSTSSADQVLNDMLEQFWDGAHAEFRPSTTSYWINAQAFDAVLDGVARTQGKSFTGWIAKVHDANRRQFGGWLTASYGETYFDDITWMTLALVRASELSSGAEKAQCLKEAEEVFGFVMSHAPSYADGKFDGLWWSSAHDFDEKATASNFGPVIAAARLYERTGEPVYRSFAIEVYDYWHAHMVVAEADGTAFVLDSLQRGQKETPRYTYNQGLGVGAALAMVDLSTLPSHKATHLAEAIAMGDYIVQHETHEEVLLDYDSNDSTASACTGDCAAFKGVAYRYLAALYERDTSRADYYQVLHSSAHAILANDHDEGVRFGTRWDIRGYEDSAKLAANASAVMAIQIFAQLPQPDGAGAP